MIKINKANKPNKPFLTFNNQKMLLKVRNIKIENNKDASRLLNTVSYYKLINGYKETFLINSETTEKFIDNLKIEDLYTLHIFDTKLQAILFRHILSIENSLKTKISYLVSKKYGVFEEEYLNKLNYTNSNNKRRDTALEEINKTLNKAKYNPTRYYKKGDLKNNISPKNHVPPWIVINNVSFWVAIEWYAILKNDDKTKILKNYDFFKNHNLYHSKELFITFLFILLDYRNNVAHGYRSIQVNLNRKIPRKALLSIVNKKVITRHDYDKGIGVNDLFAVLIAIVSLNDYLIFNKELITELYNLFNTNVGLTVINIAKLPKDFIKRLENIYITK